MVKAAPKPVAERSVPARFIYVAGCDGTGKSTQASLLMSRLREENVPATRRWLRFPFLSCLPLLAYARWRGFSWYEDGGDHCHGYWSFRRSWLLRTLFPRLLWLDAALATLLKVWVPISFGKVIVCERFVLDMLVDLALAFGQPVLGSSTAANLFLSLLPSRSLVFVLDLEAEIIRERRPDLRSDRLLESRLAAYRQLAAQLTLPVLSSQIPPEHLCQTIWQTVFPTSQQRQKS